MTHSPRDLLEWARDRGWIVNKTNSNHWRLRHPNGSVVFLPGTPSDWRSLNNAKAKLKRVERNGDKHAKLEV